MSDSLASHAFVLPGRDFSDWLAVLRPYMAKFEQVDAVRSPAGSDLNRYRNVTAVQAPLTWWQDSALKHIRRIYPQVVMIDIIEAATPQQLAPILRRRICLDDRYGHEDSSPPHIFDRFAWGWPVNSRLMTVIKRYNAKPQSGPLHESLDLQTSPGADVLCAAAGRVAAIQDDDSDLGFRALMQIETRVADQRFITTYEGIRDIKVKLGDSVTLGQALAQSQSGRLRIIIQNPPDNGVDLFRLKNVVNPRDYIYIPGLRVRPTVNGLRIRALPSLQSKILGLVHSWELLEPLEHHGRAIEKIGARGKWLKLRASTGLKGYALAWHLEAITEKRGSEVFPGVNPVGVNLDAYHPRGRPDPSRLGDLGWLRFGYNVSNRKGSQDINAALQRYLPLMEAYRRAGYRIVFTTSHQTYGEGRNEFWPWTQMTDAKWNALIERFARMMHSIARQWAKRDLIAAWQIWNEQDVPIGSSSAVPMPARVYTRLFDQAHRAIRSADSQVQILTGGFASGPNHGSAYARQLVRNLPTGIEPDGIAFHPYGRGVNGHPRYAPFGHIDEMVWAYSQVMPRKPLWITEWGALDRSLDSVHDVAGYAGSFIHHLKRRYAGKIAAIIWYAWAEGMHNGYGIVDMNNKPRPPLSDIFLKWTKDEE